MAIEATEPKRRVQPMECASIRYTCEQVEDSIQGFRASIERFREWKSGAQKDLEEREKADYLGNAKEWLIKSAEVAVERNEGWIAEYESGINRLLEILQEAKALEKHMLEFWAEKSK